MSKEDEMKTLIKFFKKLTAKKVSFEKGRSPYSVVNADDGTSHAMARKYGVGL